MKNTSLLLIAPLLGWLTTHGQCPVNITNSYSFSVNGIGYEIVKEKLSWVNAAACAVSRGGKLAELNSKAEQDTVFYYVNQAGITAANTIAPDGGGASYIWLGGNDITTEGSWVWDGANTGSSTAQFWQGTSSGSAVGGLYNNWGNEPDNWNGQDGLGLAFTNWPLGLAGQWNDVKETNQLYYIIEYPMIATGLPEYKAETISLYPQPAGDRITLKAGTIQVQAYRIINMLGNVVLNGSLNQERMIDISSLPGGLYYLATDQSPGISKLIKQ